MTSTTAAATKDWVTPGTKLGSINDLLPGPGTFIRGNFIYSSLVGKKTFSENPQSPTSPAKEKRTISVVGKKRTASAAAPTIGSVATVKITKINSRFATAQIICVSESPLKEPFIGIIRSQDVRPTEIDTVEISKCFRPGDIVLCEIISLGDARSFYLSTAKTEHGVIYAQSVAGAVMNPISWNQMICPKTHSIEFRKVAKQPQK